MKKIIYCSIVPPVEKRSGKRRDVIKERVFGILRLSYPVTEKCAVFLGCQTEAYIITGKLQNRKRPEHLFLKEEAGDGRQKSTGWTGAGIIKKEAVKKGLIKEDIRWRRTLRKLKKRIQKKEMQEYTKAQEAFLFCSWEEGSYPAGLLLSYYIWQYQKQSAVQRAEQLVVFDGSDMAEDTEEENGNAEKEEIEEIEEAGMVSQICGTYNYAVVVTRRAGAWEKLQKQCYEEYGLSLILTSDHGNLHFRDKRTLVLDWGAEGRKCLRNLPKGSVYMDFYRSVSKRRMIGAKCREILYLSPCNALDTALRDTV